MDALECTKILKALGEDTRIQIFEMLRNGKLCACKMIENTVRLRNCCFRKRLEMDLLFHKLR